MQSFTIASEVGDDFALHFTDAGTDEIFVTSGDDLLRLETGRVAVTKPLKATFAVRPVDAGRLFVAQNFKKAPIVVDRKTLKPIATLTAHKKTMTSAAVDPLGRFAASGAEGGELLLHDLKTAKASRFVFPKWPKQKNNPPIDSLRFSGDGKYLVASASDLKGQVRVLSVPDLKEVFVSRTDGHDSLTTTHYLSNARDELVLAYSFNGDDESWQKTEIVRLGEKKAKDWAGTWADHDEAMPRMRNAKWHLIFDSVGPVGEPSQPSRVVYTARVVDQYHRWGGCEGFVSDRTLYWWQAGALPAELDVAGPGEAFLEVVVASGGDEKAAAKLMAEPVKWVAGELPWFGVGKRAQLKLPREKAIEIAAKLRSLDKINVALH